ncbi:MAG: hypothetical protein V3V61_06470 [Gammaproteobacteria bacterium]
MAVEVKDSGALLVNTGDGPFAPLLTSDGVGRSGIRDFTDVEPLLRHQDETKSDVIEAEQAAETSRYPGTGRRFRLLGRFLHESSRFFSRLPGDVSVVTWGFETAFRPFVGALNQHTKGMRAAESAETQVEHARQRRIITQVEDSDLACLWEEIVESEHNMQRDIKIFYASWALYLAATGTAIIMGWPVEPFFVAAALGGAAEDEHITYGKSKEVRKLCDEHGKRLSKCLESKMLEPDFKELYRVIDEDFGEEMPEVAAGSLAGERSFTGLGADLPLAKFIASHGSSLVAILVGTRLFFDELTPFSLVGKRALLFYHMVSRLNKREVGYTRVIDVREKTYALNRALGGVFPSELKKKVMESLAKEPSCLSGRNKWLWRGLSVASASFTTALTLYAGAQFFVGSYVNPSLAIVKNIMI